MKRKIIFIFILLFILLGENLFSANRFVTFYISIDGQYKKVNGNYKKCTIYVYNYKFGEVDINSKRKYLSFKFDLNGYITECEDFTTSQDGFFSKYKNKYDSRGNRIEQITYNPQGEAIYKQSYKYNENGRLIENIEYYSWGIGDKFIFKYDSKGFMFERFFCKNNDSIECYNKYITDEKGHIIEETAYFYGNGIKKTIYKCDQIGNLIEEVGYDELDEPSYKLEYIYSK
ncbi:MAG: hypothetical protein WCT77_09590 [Bacteroidota bacterium]